MSLLYFFFFTLISSCSLVWKNKAPETAKGSQYRLNFSSPGWSLKQDNRSDYVLENLNDGRIMLSNSFCEEFQEQPLDVLATKTFRTVSDFKVSKHEYVTFRGREAYRSEGIGKVDGVAVELRLLNTRRNNCYFDFFAITPLSSTRTHTDFEAFLDSVEFR
jgi:hypothetical protein